MIDAEASDRQATSRPLDTLLRGLDAAQRDAITTDAGPLAIVAAAGSGKTTVLARRIVRRVLDGSAAPSHVVAVSFSRDAARELRRRVSRVARSVGLPDSTAGQIESGTFHAIALRLLTDHALVHGRPAPRIAGDRLRLVREALASIAVDLDPRQAMADLDWAQARLVPPSEYEVACMAAQRRSNVVGARFAEFADAYARLKRRRGVVDFDDLLVDCLGYASTDRQFRERVQWRFRHFFVDEAQDLNPLQHQLLESWRAGRNDLCIVGDPRQAIYGWNGADSTLLEHVEARYPQVTVVRLRTNYRCSDSVIAAARSTLATIGVADDTLGLSDAPTPTPVRRRNFDDEHEEARWVADQVVDATRRHRASDVAVLARTNEQLDPLERAVRATGLATTRGHGESAARRLVADIDRNGRDAAAAWIEASESSTEALRRRVALAADRWLASGSEATLAAWVDDNDDLTEAAPDEEGAVTITTFHAAKGREWRAVFVTGVERSLVPHFTATSDEQIAEEARLLYVATTRAADELTYTSCSVRRGRRTGASPWLDGVVTVSDVTPTPPPMTLRRSVVDPLAPLREWRSQIARASGVDARAVCPDRVLRSLLDDPPTTPADLAKRLGITESAAQRLRPLPHRP